MIATSIGINKHWMEEEFIVEQDDFFGTVYEDGATEIVIPRIQSTQVTYYPLEDKGVYL